MPSEQLSAEQRTAWFIDGSSKVNGQHSIWKVTTVIEDERKLVGQTECCFSSSHWIIEQWCKKKKKKSPYAWVFTGL